MLERVGEVFNKEGDPGPSSVLALLLPALLRLVPVNVLILKNYWGQELLCTFFFTIRSGFTPWATE